MTNDQALVFMVDNLILGVKANQVTAQEAFEILTQVREDSLATERRNALDYPNKPIKY